MKIIGLDPGLNYTGWSILCVDKNVKLVDKGVIITNNKEATGKRLKKIYNDLISVLELHCADIASMEEVFINNNPKSSISLCYARGILLLALSSINIPVVEYSTTYIKKSVTGNGHAKKEQVHFMIEKILGIKCLGTYDISDAIAVALCHAYSKF